MLIKKHDKSDIVELEDGSLWRIWPGDVALTDLELAADYGPPHFGNW
jgi:hypothetical protein